MSKTFHFFSGTNRDLKTNDIIKNFKESWSEDRAKTLQILLNLRDPRNGSGEKNSSRIIFALIKKEYPVLYKILLSYIIEYGSWKDLLEIAVLTKDISSEIEVKYIASQLMKDIKTIDNKVSLCAKWAPSEGSSFDKGTLKLASKIMTELNMRPREYRKMLSSLRSKINLVEVNMSGHKFELISFEQVPSKCHMIYKDAFSRIENAKKCKDPKRSILVQRYSDYKEKLANKEVSIKFKGLQPHEIVSKYKRDYQVDIVLEEQWAAIRDSIKKVGLFKNSIAICDVSGSMTGLPMDVSIALGILISEVCEGPYKNNVITFSNTPEIHNISGNSLLSKINVVSKMSWGMNTNMTKVFELLLNIALIHKLKQDEMIDTIFILTDMEFNCAVSTQLLENNQFSGYFNKKISEEYNKNGYKLPKIVLWNLRSSPNNRPFNETDENVAILSGFSAEMLKGLLEFGLTSPIDLMNNIIKKYVLSQEILDVLNTL